MKNKVALFKTVLKGYFDGTWEERVSWFLSTTITNIQTLVPKQAVVSSFYTEQMTPFLWVADFTIRDVTGESPEEFTNYHCRPISE